MPRSRFLVIDLILEKVVASLTGCLALTTVAGAIQADDSWTSRQHAATAVFNVSARQVDSALPDVRLLAWIQNVVGIDAKIFPGGYSSLCENEPSFAAPPPNDDAPWNLCASLDASLSDGRQVAIAVSASVVRDSSRPGEWKALSAHLVAAYVVDPRPGPRQDDSLDVPVLRGLPRALALPIADWPHAELRISPGDLRLEPSSFRPGDRITVAVTVRNVGHEPARVHVTVTETPECSDIGGVLRELEGTVRAGQATTWRSEITAPNLPRWILGASVDLMPVTQIIQKYQMSSGSKGTSKLIGRRPSTKCSPSG